MSFIQHRDPDRRGHHRAHACGQRHGCGGISVCCGCRRVVPAA